MALALAANTIVMFGGIITKDHYDDEHKKSEIQQFEPNPSDSRSLQSLSDPAIEFLIAFKHITLTELQGRVHVRM
jgi:hypothetical protein